MRINNALPVISKYGKLFGNAFCFILDRIGASVSSDKQAALVDLYQATNEPQWHVKTNYYLLILVITKWFGIGLDVYLRA